MPSYWDCVEGMPVGQKPGRKIHIFQEAFLSTFDGIKESEFRFSVTYRKEFGQNQDCGEPMVGSSFWVGTSFSWVTVVGLGG